MKLLSVRNWSEFAEGESALGPMFLRMRRSRRRFGSAAGPRGASRPLGEALFGSWVLPFELVSVLLLAALVAAVAVSRGRSGDDGARR